MINEKMRTWDSWKNDLADDPESVSLMNLVERMSSAEREAILHEAKLEGDTRGEELESLMQAILVYEKLLVLDKKD